MKIVECTICNEKFTCQSQLLLHGRILHPEFFEH